MAEQFNRRDLLVLGIWAVIGFGLWAWYSGDDDPRSAAVSVSVRGFENLSPQDQAFATRAIWRFQGQCTRLTRHWIDVEHAAAEMKSAAAGNLPPFADRDYGWNQLLQIQVKIKTDPTSIPHEYFAQGHTCHIDVGDGERPGIYVSKAACLKLCDIDQGKTPGEFGRFIPLSRGTPAK